MFNPKFRSKKAAGLLPMHQWRLSCVGVAAALTVAGEALAQQYEDLLIEALEAAANEECPDSIMSPMLLDACEQQMPGIGRRIASLGPIQEARYRGTQPTQMGPAEVYGVHFQHGRMTWMINTGTDGKILVFWTPG